jgi:hypothetical protein
MSKKGLRDCKKCIFDAPWPQDCEHGLKMIHLADECPKFKCHPLDMPIGMPEKCCKVGTYKCQVPMPLNGRRQDIDICIADIVAALNAANIRTVASCCGHGSPPASILLGDGRSLQIYGVKP